MKVGTTIAANTGGVKTAGIVTSVHSDTCVNAFLFPDGLDPYAVSSITDFEIVGGGVSLDPDAESENSPDKSDN